MNDRILQFLTDNKDDKYADFQRTLITSAYPIIGVRTPLLKKEAAIICSDTKISEFLDDLPHVYFEQFALHSFVLSKETDFDTAVFRLKELLPYLDNWALCDQLKIKCFGKNIAKLPPLIDEFLSSNHTYTIRFAIGLLMSYFLDEYFSEECLNKVCNVKSEEYYVNMMRAWYFAATLAKQYHSTIKLLESGSLDKWTHNKTIQKAIESYRIADARKTYLRSLKIK